MSESLSPIQESQGPMESQEKTAYHIHEIAMMMGRKALALQNDAHANGLSAVHAVEGTPLGAHVASVRHHGSPEEFIVGSGEHESTSGRTQIEHIVDERGISNVSLSRNSSEFGGGDYPEGATRKVATVDTHYDEGGRKVKGSFVEHKVAGKNVVETARVELDGSKPEDLAQIRQNAAAIFRQARRDRHAVQDAIHAKKEEKVQSTQKMRDFLGQ